MLIGRETPRISILLPVWNAESTLDLCLRSILRESEQNWECILVDDGSTDGSLVLANSFAARDRRIQVISRPHEGLIATLNFGVPFCQAPIVARMDADDWMHRDRLELQLSALNDNPRLDAVGAFTRSFPRRELTTGRRRYEAWLNSFHDAERVWMDRFIECPVAHPSLAIRRASLIRLGYRDRGWPEDWDLLLRLMRNGPRVGIVSKRLLGWRDRPDRLSRSDARYDLDRFTECRAWHLHRDFLAGHASYVLWGHGRTGRALRKALSRLGHEPRSIVEVHPRRIGETIGGVPVIDPSSLGNPSSDPVVVSVAGERPRSEIRNALTSSGFQEGMHFICAA
jgi:glycosyltransferase involved in cell wall biosynthesis